MLLVFQTAMGLRAQQTNPVGIDSIVVTFVNSPTLIAVEKAALPYNKDFALSFQMDDALADIYNIVYPLFEGVNNNGGLYYTDGCNNNISFKMSSGLNIFSFNGTDILDPDDPYHDQSKLTWTSINTLYQSGWGIYNHGVFDNPQGGGQNVMDYQIRRTQSYSRRKVSDSLLIKSFIIPNGIEAFVSYAINNNYQDIIDLRNDQDWLNWDENGINVEDPVTDWSAPLKTNRYFDTSFDLANTADYLNQESELGIHRWIPWGMHQYPQTFTTDFQYISNAYGAAGKDNVLIATDDKIADYLAIRHLTQLVVIQRNNRVTVTFTGDIPTDRNHYDLTLNVYGNQVVQNIQIYPEGNSNSNGIGNDTALINLNWEGRLYHPPSFLADSFTTLAVASQTEYDCLVAMDYVMLMDVGEEKDSLRHVLCDINQAGWTFGYEPGFCSFLIVDLGPDTTICEGNCVALSGPDDMATYEWIVADTLYSSDQSIVACPIDTTQYKLTVEDNFGNTASDSIVINVLPSVIVNIGNDTTLCSGQSLTLNGPNPPEGETYAYLWSTGEDTQSITLMATTDTLYYLDVTNSYNCTSSDTIYIYVADLPVIDTITGDTAICPGNTITLEVQGFGIESYLWSTGDTTQSIQVSPPGSDTTYWYSVSVWSGFGCMAEDSIQIRVYPMAFVDFQHDTALVCQGDDVLLSVSASTSISTFTWIYNGTDSTTTVNELNLVRPSVSDFVYLTGQTNDGCLATDSIFLNILPVPELTITADTSICSGDSIVLTIAGGDLFFWAIAGDTISNEPTIKVAPTDTTTYTVGSGFGESLCFADTNVTISILPAAATQILFDTAILCEGTEIVLIGEGADTYLWMPSGDTSQQLLMTVRDTTWVFLTGTTDQGCSSTDSLELFTLPTPVVKLSGLFSAYCENDPAVTLIGQPAGGVYTGPGVSDDLFDPQEAGPGVHSVVYALTNVYECTGFDTVVTTVYGGNQPIDLGPADTLFPDEQKILDAGEGFDSYYWSTGSNLRSITVFGVDFPHGTYEYRVIATINGCTSVGKVDITFINPDFIPESQSRTLLLYPNPNDGQFTFELPSANSAWNINIFSIYGKPVFSSLGDICQPDDCQFSLNLGSLPEGIYTIQLISGREVYTGKILIRK